jgi:predicted helicase
MSDVIKSYLAKIDREFKTGRATEHTHRPALKDLIEALDSGIRATNEPKRVECGAPDFILRRDGLSIGYMETKDLGKSLDEAEDSDQLERYKKSLPNLILTDYLEFRWFVDGQLRDSARLGRIGKANKITPDKKGIDETVQLLKLFLESCPQPITTPRELSERAAKLAHIIRDTIVEAFERDKASQDLKDLRDAFADVLIPDLNKPEKVSEFADMYAQTVVYGLFAARCNHKGTGTFQRLGAAREIPKTNPFLKKLFETITGSSLDEEPYVDFVDDLVQILANTDIEKVLENFGKRTRQEDPIVHFYETFLAAYDPKTRERRGVYYTPEPVVQYIVKSVDYILKTRFGLEGGLAHTADIVEYDREEAFLDENGRPDRSKLLKTVQEERPKVLILDPACGTGTFLYAVMDFIRAEFMKRGDAGLWSAYVRDHLLPRLFGFELLMAPYAVAHFKLGMLLAGYDLPKELQKQWQYDFEGEERLGIYLTNTLDEAPSEWQKLFGAYRILSEEANAASRVKRDLPIMVVLGNPPYSVSSANRGKWIIDLVKKNYYPNDEIKEKNLKNILDDYVKFIRWSQWRIEHTGAGILAFITNHGYLDNPTFRQMRHDLINSFTEIYILDLHGNTKKNEHTIDGAIDKNVFDIQQGVSIGIFIKDRMNIHPAKIYHADLMGSRDQKYKVLLENNILSIKWTGLTPQEPFYLFRPFEAKIGSEYRAYMGINEVFKLNSAGLYTSRDNFTVDFSPTEIWDTVLDFATISENEARQKYNLGRDVQDWKVAYAQKDIILSGPSQCKITPIFYRPFDLRFTYYTGQSAGFISRPRRQIMRQALGKNNLGFLWIRPMSPRYEFSVLSSRHIIDQCAVGNKSAGAGVSCIGFLYTYQDDIELKGTKQKVLCNCDWPVGLEGRIPNLNPDFVSAFASRLGLKFVSDGHGNLASTFGPEDIFDYIYAVFHSPTYRQRYAEFLKIDFPRVPLTSDRDLFKKLCILGEEMVALHLLESPQLTQLITRYPVVGDNIVEKGFPKFVIYEEGQPGYVYINKAQYFEGVPKEVWEFHVGGYQVCEKWLKDRRGRQLSFDDLMHYQKVVVALKETIRLMAEIDRAIPGWPIE